MLERAQPAGTSIIDFDQTVVEQWSAVPIAGVAAHLATLQQAGWRTVLVTNQAGPAWRARAGRADYPTVEEVVGRIAGGLAALAWRPDLLLVATFARADHPQQHARRAAAQITAQLRRRLGASCEASADPAWRKPGVGMLERARALGFAGPYVLIGDNHEQDGGAAGAFGARFVLAKEWHARGLEALS
jgi:histidinol phosphatase-like enzyme